MKTKLSKYMKEVTAAIHKTATQCGIKTRQILTSGYFTNSAEESRIVAKALANAGVNNLLLSVDAFHQEHIPFEPVYQFACDVIDAKISGAILYPAWLVNREHQNPYNAKTKEILEKFYDLSIPIDEYDNQIALIGQAAKLLRGYYQESELDISNARIGGCSELLKATNISIVPNGDVMVCGFVFGNIYDEDVLDVIARYNPYEHEGMNAVINGGVSGLLSYAKKHDIAIGTSNYCDACDVCETIAKKLNRSKKEKFE